MFYIYVFIYYKSQMAQNINKTVIWSDSNTKDYLTTYAEGLACNNFDKRVLYIARKQSNKIWYVMKKDIKKDDDKKINILKFVRVRIVSIDNDNFLSCSCGYVQRMLMPCSHVCCVLEKKQFYIPSLFHIRWYKDFNYYYQRDFGKKNGTRNNISFKFIIDGNTFKELYKVR